MLILLIDDDPNQVRRYQKVILELGHEVESVDDPLLAWDLLQEEVFDAVISDVQMPVMSGFELVQRMFYFRHEIPTLLHSSESRHSTGHEWVDLTKTSEKFTFVTFAQKHFNIQPTYIKDFLEKVAQERPDA